MKTRIKQIAFLSLFGFIIGTSVAWRQVSEEAKTAARIEPSSGPALAGAAIGGAFTLTDHNGRTVTDRDYEGSYKLVFFGFTHCPDVCPAGLQKMAAALDAMGPEAAMVQPLFITVDPGRDTPEVMKEYVEMFHPRLTGLTGSAEQTQAVQKAYKVYAAKEEDEILNGYMMNHSAYTYFMGPRGEPLTLFSAEDTPAAMAREMMQLMPQDSL